MRTIQRKAGWAKEDLLIFKKEGGKVPSLVNFMKPKEDSSQKQISESILTPSISKLSKEQKLQLTQGINELKIAARILLGFLRSYKHKWGDCSIRLSVTGNRARIKLRNLKRTTVLDPL